MNDELPKKIKILKILHEFLILYIVCWYVFVISTYINTFIPKEFP